MSTLLYVRMDDAPPWPATDQHPDAMRYQFDVDGRTVWVDAIGDAPSADEVRAALNPPQTVLTYPEFRARWSDDEKAALHAARASSWQIDDYIGVAQAANLVDLGSDEAVAAKAAIVAAGVLTHDRGDVIFAAS